jgi:hypothetical protein
VLEKEVVLYQVSLWEDRLGSGLHCRQFFTALFISRLCNDMPNAIDDKKIIESVQTIFILNEPCML